MSVQQSFAIRVSSYPGEKAWHFTSSREIIENGLTILSPNLHTPLSTVHSGMHADGFNPYRGDANANGQPLKVCFSLDTATFGLGSLAIMIPGQDKDVLRTILFAVE